MWIEGPIENMHLHLKTFFQFDKNCVSYGNPNSKNCHTKYRKWESEMLPMLTNKSCVFGIMVK